MTIYNLEDTPDVFISPKFARSEFEYIMAQFNGENNRKLIRSIDLRNDKLMIHGTEIKESSYKRLHECLVLRSEDGYIYVNCDGACYFRIVREGYFTPINNVIFNWSHFGVTVPDSVNYSLNQQLEQKEKEVNNLNNQLSSSEANLKSSMEEVGKLKEELSSCKKDMEVKLQEACQRFALVDFELELYKIELDSYKKGEEELLDQICSCREESRKGELELQKTQAQLSSVNSELQSTKVALENSTENTRELGHLLSFCRKETEEIKRKQKTAEEENSMISLELESFKNKLELSNNIVKDREEIISSYKKENEHREIELQKLRDQLSSANQELESTKTMLDSSGNEVKELKNQLYSHMREQKYLEAELRKVFDCICSINSAMMSNNLNLDQLLISKLWVELDGFYDRKSETNMQCSDVVIDSSSVNM